MESVLLLVHWTNGHLACVMMGSTEIPKLGETSPEPSVASQEGAKTCVKDPLKPVSMGTAQAPALSPAAAYPWVHFFFPQFICHHSETNLGGND